MGRLGMMLAVAAIGAAGAGSASAGDRPLKAPPMTFFVTSAGPGKGGDLGGLKGADRRCAALARAAGARAHRWRAYLSAADGSHHRQVDARDRIGKGPWRNAKGVLIAQDVTALHMDSVNLNKQTALTESGATVNGRGDMPNRHDILTGSAADGTLARNEKGEPLTCRDWTSSDGGSAQLGHHDRTSMQPGLSSWNSAHPSRGCSPAELQSTGGDGLLYCFATQ